MECCGHAASKDANDVNCFMPLKAFPKSYPSIGEEEWRRMLILMVMKNDDNRQTSKTHNTEDKQTTQMTIHTRQHNQHANKQEATDSTHRT